MAWKHHTKGKATYFVNLEQVAYLQQHESATTITFTATAENGNLSIAVDQRAVEILSGEDMS